MLYHGVMLDAADVLDSGLGKDRFEVAGPAAGDAHLVAGVRVERHRHPPERADRRPPTGQVPSGRGHGAARPGDPRHLPHARHGIVHEVDDELREGDVELAVAERQLLGAAAAHVDAGKPAPDRVNEGL